MNAEDVIFEDPWDRDSPIEQHQARARELQQMMLD